MRSTMFDYDAADATAMAEAVRAGATTPAALLAEARRRADAAAALNAIVQRFDPPAASAEGAFAGVPFLLKDLGADLAGQPTTNGSLFYAAHTPASDDAFVSRLKAAGLAIFGKTNTPELGMRPVTEGKLYGAARNPWNLALTPGGSSGGAAAAGGGRHRAGGARQRYRRLAAHSGKLLRRVRLQALPRPPACWFVAAGPARRHEHAGLHHPLRPRQRGLAGRHARRRPVPPVRPGAARRAFRARGHARPNTLADRLDHRPALGPHCASGIATPRPPTPPCCCAR